MIYIIDYTDVADEIWMACSEGDSYFRVLEPLEGDGSKGSRYPWRLLSNESIIKLCEQSPNYT